MNTKLEYLEIIPKKVNNIFILLHGYGVDAEDLFSVGMRFRDLLPNTAFLSVNAPWKCEAGSGFQWFSLENMNLFAILKEIKMASKLLDDFIDEQLKRFSLENKNLFLCGFSQGAIISLYNSIRRSEAPFAVLSFSGMMAETVDTLQNELVSKPEILLVHGTIDKTVPYSMLQRTEELLREFDIPYESYSIDGMGHMINDEAIEHGRNFIKRICNTKN